MGPTFLVMLVQKKISTVTGVTSISVVVARRSIRMICLLSPPFASANSFLQNHLGQPLVQLLLLQALAIPFFKAQFLFHHPGNFSVWLSLAWVFLPLPPSSPTPSESNAGQLR